MSEEDQPQTCMHCGESPCDWVTYRAQLSSVGFYGVAMYQEEHPDELDAVARFVLCRSTLFFFFSSILYFVTYSVAICMQYNRLRGENKSARWHAFSDYSRSKNGYLGKGNRKPHPVCIENGVRAMFPDPDGHYIGFRPAANRTQRTAQNAVNMGNPNEH
jgi:hypothetical protein